MKNDFLASYIIENGESAVDIIINSHLDAIEDVEGENKEKVLYHIASIRNVLSTAKKIYPRFETSQIAI